MSRIYDVKETYTGTGSKSDYTFDFKIEALTQLLIIELDDTGVETQRVRGDDVVYLSSVDFDAINGAGTVNLASNLAASYTLLILLANDEPSQPYQFKNKGTFTLQLFERALDFVQGAVQRLAYRANQALRLDDQNAQTVDARIMHDGVLSTSPLLSNNAERFVRVNDAGKGFVFGETLDEIGDTVFPTATTQDQIPVWSGSAWEAKLYSGKRLVSNTQSIASGGNIAVNGAIQQILKVQGNGGAQTASVTPFSGTLFDGMEITIVGKSDANPLTIQYANITDGCMLNGDCVLSNGDTLTLVYDLSDRRFYEISRSK